MFPAGKQFAALLSLAVTAAALPMPALAADPAAPLLVLAPPAPAVSAAEPFVPAAAATAGAPLSLPGDPAARLVLLIAAAAAAWNSPPEPETSEISEATAAIDAELECMAKVVAHEAGNQPRLGQLAVAQVILNRMESGRFPTTACGVANQHGQFFSTASYHPRRDSATWASAVEVARAARDGRAEKVAPGSLFFHAAYASAGNFFRTRQRVATLGDHIFYR